MSKSNAVQDGRSKKRPGLDEQKRVVVNAAVELFSKNGSASVSIAEICSRADIGRQTFYRCFASKDELIRHIFQHAVNEHIDTGLSGLLADKTDKDWMFNIVDQVLDAILGRHRLAQLIYLDSKDKNSLAYRIFEEAVDKAADAIQEWFVKHCNVKPSKLFLKSVIAGTTYLIQHAIEVGLTQESITQAKHCAKQLFQGAYLSVGSEGLDVRQVD